MTVTTGDNKFGVSKWIVDPTPGLGTHTTITAALADAVSGESIFIRSGTYTEDLTLKAGVSLQSFIGNENAGEAIIVGKCSLSETGSAALSGLELQTNNDFCIEVTGANASNLTITDCTLRGVNNTIIEFSNSNSSSVIFISECSGTLETTGIAVFTSTSPGALQIERSIFGNSGVSVTASTISAGEFNLLTASFANAISATGTAQLGIAFVGLSIVPNTTMVTFNSSGTCNIQYSVILSGTASAVSIGGGSTARIVHSQLNSTNANIVSGAGTLNFSSLIDLSQGTGNVLGTTNLGGINILQGRIRSPTQPAFLATLPSSDANVTGDGTVYTLGGTTALTEIFDQNGDFDTNGTFTAPVTGKYNLTGYFLLTDIDNMHDDCQVVFVTSNRSYKVGGINPGDVRNASNDLVIGGSVFADMDAGDTATFTIFVSGGTLTVDVFGDGTPETYFSGYLVF